jgi:hypothetical protein
MSESLTSVSAPVGLSRPRRSPQRDATIAALAGFIGSVLIVVTAPVRTEAAPTWRLHIPFIPAPGPRWFSTSAFIAGVGLLGYGWILLGSYARRKKVDGGVRLRTVSIVIMLWSVPIVLGPPLLSNDVYSYAAQGELASRGYDPTKWGPIALGGGPFLRAADDIWHHNPSPYGPVWNKLAAGVVTVTGHDPANAVWGFRVVIALSVLVCGWALARLARELGADPAFALVMGVGNPLMLLHILGGIHNDGLMLALLLVGLVLARRRHRGLALFVITAAAAVKLPAAAGLVYLGWNWRDELDTRAKRLLGAVVAGVVGMILIVWLSVEVRMGMGWIGALRGTSKVMSTFAPVTMSGMVVTEILHIFGIEISSDRFVNMFRMAGLLGAGGLAWLLLYNCRRIGTELALGLTLVLVVVLGPVMWPWYVPPAVALLAANGAERFRPALTVSCISIAFFVFPISAGHALAPDRFHSVFGMGVVAVVTAGAMLAQWLAGESVLPGPILRQWRRRRSEAAAEVVVPAA